MSQPSKKMDENGRALDPSQWVSNKEARKILDVSPSTLRNYTLSNKIVTVKTNTGRNRYNRESLYAFMGIECNEVQKVEKSICYARVSSSKQKDDLERQIEFFRHKYPNHEVVFDIGSGINWKRKGLQTILEQSMQGNVKEVVVAHRDRLSRFGFELIEFVLNKSGVKLVVHNNKNDKSESEELADDIMSIVHVYSCRQMGKRRYVKKNQRNKEDKAKSDIKAKIDIE